MLSVTWSVCVRQRGRLDLVGNVVGKGSVKSIAWSGMCSVHGLPTTYRPVQLVYNLVYDFLSPERLIEVELKLTEEAWDSDLEDKSSGSYAYLAADVKAAVSRHGGDIRFSSVPSTRF